jgi:hypothetical protein
MGSAMHGPYQPRACQHGWHGRAGDRRVVRTMHGREVQVRETTGAAPSCSGRSKRDAVSLRGAPSPPRDECFECRPYRRHTFGPTELTEVLFQGGMKGTRLRSSESSGVLGVIGLPIADHRRELVEAGAAV